MRQIDHDLDHLNPLHVIFQYLLLIGDELGYGVQRWVKYLERKKAYRSEDEEDDKPKPRKDFVV